MPANPSIPEKIIHIDLGPTSYDAVLCYNNIANIGKYLHAVASSKTLFIITDSKVGPLHGPRLEAILRQGGYTHIHLETVPEGEASKSIETWTHLLGELHKFTAGKEEKPVILNLGGGMVGDLGGFLAATYTRGCPYIQIPTTLMAMVDSSLGGKVGIDYATVKNIIGSFYQPRLVFLDVGFLKTLDIREVRSGLAEVVKYGVIKDPSLFDYTEKYYGALLALDPASIFHVTAKCLEIKARIVEQDPLDEKGIRIVLNYGHTIGHAIEAVSEYSYKHGEAVSIGMVGANFLAYELGLLDKEKAGRVKKLLENIGLPTTSRQFDISRVMGFLVRDKKFTNRTNRFVLPADIGHVKIVSALDENLIEKAIRHVTAA